LSASRNPRSIDADGALAKRRSGWFAILSVTDALRFPLFRLGGRVLISALRTKFPRKLAQLCHHGLRGNMR